MVSLERRVETKWEKDMAKTAMKERRRRRRRTTRWRLKEIGKERKKGKKETFEKQKQKGRKGGGSRA